MEIDGSNVKLKGDFSWDKFDKKKFSDHCDYFFERVLDNIKEHTGINLGNRHAYQLISIGCLLNFAKFWQKPGFIAPATYFECPSLVGGFKNYKKYAKEIFNEQADNPSVNYERVWTVLVTTIWSMLNLERSNDGKLDAYVSDWGGNDPYSLKRLFERLELPSTPKKSKQTSKISTVSSLTITQEDLKNDFARYSWSDMENLVGKLFEKKGYAVTVTPPSGDFGIDVEATNASESIGIQVKHWTKDVGYEDIAKTLGSSMGKFNKSIIISSKSGFTAQALKKQSEMPFVLELWDVSRLKNEMQRAFLKNQSNTSTSGKFCTQCGLQCVPDAKFCHGCGGSLIKQAGKFAKTVNSSENRSKTTHHTSYEKGSKIDKVYNSSGQETDSFDYDQGFNLDEVYDSPNPHINNEIICKECQYINPKEGILCGKCGRAL